MNVWNRLGFRENLYSTPPLHGDAEGSRLIVGRDQEITELQEHWASFETHASIEGSNGVGKTSLVAVAIYRDTMKRERSRQSLILPVGEPFQMTSDSERLDRQVYLALARALLENELRLEGAGYPLPRLGDLRRWMDSPAGKSHGASGSAWGFGGGGSFGYTANTSIGFSDNGLPEFVRTVLESIFSSKAAGGFVGILDNLELLNTSKEARQRLEEMRDSILDIPGVHWVLCGANGIVRSVVGSPRLNGRIADPIRLEPLRSVDVPIVIQRRIDEYKVRDSAVPPVDPESFTFMYKVLNENLRIALKHAEDFTKVFARDIGADKRGYRSKLMREWLMKQSASYAEDAGALTPRAWKVFDELIQTGGECRASDFDRFGYASQQAMRPFVKALEDVNLVNSTIDETDSRRRTIEVTPSGWLVNYHRSGYAEP